VKRGFAGDGGGHFFGYATCHWLRGCTGEERPGSPCSATLSGVEYAGYCFTSDTGSLECGHLAAMDDQYGERPVAFDARASEGLVAGPTSTSSLRVVSPNVLPSQAGRVAQSGATLLVKPSTPGASGIAYRCPTGSPAKSLGAYVSKRLLVAGCMISTDAQFDELADIHVPAYCSMPADFMVGCLVRTASNYDPSAKQSGHCVFATRGCISPTALNYNSEATLDDPEHPCIEPIRGCTVSAISYAGVASDTPQFRSGVYAPRFSLLSPVAETQYNGPAVVNHDPSANVNSGCVVAVEGCMDSGAVNYDPHATVNSFSWCIPSVVGCMNPDSPSYDPRATKHNSTSCAIHYVGCMDPKATNYVPNATLDKPFLCSYAKAGYNEGCLNPLALNYGCNRNLRQTSPCSGGVVTHHARAACNWLSMPPAPPAAPFMAPQAPPGMMLVAVHSVQCALDAAGDVADVQNSTLFDFKSKFANLLTVELQAIEATARASSVRIVIAIQADDSNVADNMESTLTTTLGSSIEEAEAFLGNAVMLIALPTVEKVVTYTLTQEDAAATSAAIGDASTQSGAVVGSLVGSLVGWGAFLAVVGVLCFWRWYRRKHRMLAVAPEAMSGVPRRDRIEFDEAGSQPEPPHSGALSSFSGGVAPISPQVAAAAHPPAAAAYLAPQDQAISEAQLAAATLSLPMWGGGVERADAP